jgi:ATP-dependent helicase HrpA
MAAELVETTRLYARVVASVEADWLEQVGAHLIKRHQYEPHWEKKPARVAAFERGTLYGLPVYTSRRIHYGPMDPKTAREIFIRQALVEGHYESRAPFFAHNQGLLHQIEEIEHKSRRPDVLVDDELIYAFYDSLVPEGIHNGAAFEVWRKEVEAQNPKLLFLRREDLMRHEAAGITTAQFPHQLELAGRTYALEYLHDPGGARDGVTMTVPLVALNQVPAARVEWLVPGLLKDKVQALAKSLPQRIRHRLGPLAEFAAEFTHEVQPGDMPLTEAIARYARSALQLDVSLDGFRLEALPAHLNMNFLVVDEHGRQLAMGRSLPQLRTELGQQAGEQFAAVVQPRAALEGITDWTFHDLQEVMEIKSGSQTLIGYPALVDEGESVSLQVFDAQDKAHDAHRIGLRRLFMLQFKEQLKYLEKNLPNLQAMSMQYASLGEMADLKRQLIAATVDRACLGDPLPSTRSMFERRRDEAKTRLNLISQELARLVGTILSEYQVLGKKLQALKSFPEVQRDMQEQLGRLLTKDFIEAMPYERLQHFPRYLKAASLRLDKLRADPARDIRGLGELLPLQTQWLREEIKVRKQGTADPQLDQFRWLLEELRVQLFAQELRTPAPVSVKRLQKMWESMRR